MVGGESKPTAAIWWRVSTAAQIDLSPDTQIKESAALLEAEGYSVPKEYIVGADWHSLNTLDCPEMQKLLGWMRTGEIQAVGMINSDRLSGEMAHKLAIMDIAKKAGVRLLAVQTPIETGPDGQLLETVRTYAKYLQVMRAQQGSKDGLRDRVLVKGLPATGRAAFGYSFATERGGNGAETTNHALLLPDDNWHVARDIWQMALSGTSLRSIVKALHDRGIRTARGRDFWRPKGLADLLHNPVYAGRYYAMRFTYKKNASGSAGTSRTIIDKLRPIDEWVHLPGVVVERPIVTWDQFLEVQERLTLNKLRSKRNSRYPYLLRGMIRCETHNRTYRGWRGRTETRVLYKCLGMDGVEFFPTACNRPSIGGQWLEQEIWDRAFALLSDPEKVIGEVELAQDVQAETEGELSDAITSIQKRRSRLDGQEMELVGMRMRNEVRALIYDRQMSLLKAERIWCAEEEERLTRQLADVRRRFATVAQVKALCDRVGDRLTGQDRRFVLEALGTAISVRGGWKPDSILRAPRAIGAHCVYDSRVNEYGTCPTSS